MSNPAPTTRAESRDAVRTALIAWKEDGVPYPILPVYSDLDGDGIPDFYGLDDANEVITVSGVNVIDTVSVSLGTGLEQEGGALC